MSLDRWARQGRQSTPTRCRRLFPWENHWSNSRELAEPNMSDNGSGNAVVEDNRPLTLTEGVESGKHQQTAKNPLFHSYPFFFL
jgi:hypothetical protein